MHTEQIYPLKELKDWLADLRKNPKVISETIKPMPFILPSNNPPNDFWEKKLLDKEIEQRAKERQMYNDLVNRLHNKPASMLDEMVNVEWKASNIIIDEFEKEIEKISNKKQPMEHLIYNNEHNAKMYVTFIDGEAHISVYSFEHQKQYDFVIDENELAVLDMIRQFSKDKKNGKEL